MTYSFDGVEPGIYSLADAKAAGKLGPPLVNERGDVAAAFSNSENKVVSGKFSFGGQSHFCMEKHSALSVPDERGRMRVNCGSQGPDIYRQFTAAVLGKSGLDIDVNVRRMGGAFGAKFTKNA